MNETTKHTGRFSLGCNYWASHAGIEMWSDANWRPEVVDADFRLLAESGLRTVRVFPLWPEFQPIKRLYTAMGRACDTVLPDDGGDPALRRAGVSRAALEKFQVLADLASKHGLELIVGLVTGWMSGRLFVPPALEERNILTDPAALMWQVRFVRAFVSRFRTHAAIVSWDLGNECNCLAAPGSREAAWSWTAQISDAIRAEDATRPVISGMHSLSAGRDDTWSIEDQAELTDVLTIHPYPPFTPHCDRDRLGTIRSGLHATAEGCLYADVGGKPCLAEEVGTLGPMLGSERRAADYLRGALFSLWAHGNEGLLWWCAFDQDHLAYAPYEWSSPERELGLFRNDRAPKPVVAEFTAFEAFLKTAPVLAPRRRRAVCILTDDQDRWGVAYASFILSKQAGFEVEFQSAHQPLRDADLYLLPSVSGFNAIPRAFGIALNKRIESGATLYLSLNDGFLADFGRAFGMEVEARCQRTVPAEIAWAGEIHRVASPYRLDLNRGGAEVLAREADGNPAFVRFARGKGQAYFLSVPIELDAVKAPGAFEERNHAAFYREIGAGVRARHVVRNGLPGLGVTEHPAADGRLHLVLVNYGRETLSFTPDLAPGWSVAEVVRGRREGAAFVVPPQDGVVVTLKQG
ncbi:Glycosyl hydrolases family 2, TIM barrel domain [Verrucomicrobium sp. GAS474]|uniref:glycoside hydrolase family 2 TIM barrel-domain containing protein n=1 Tax=Verrucomicrobium sp. GAS474 TaxID=1882831 RepID=UPI00087A8D7F|nr:glycoside hydrolase family 2 TIM barrel-domain containing protein [Verrucomicrobium sp. GAS474]SDT99127.1 Glycosyl hydrolases family 2, TIM barrel domain [Verrucomicrobium sp. GAS474]